MVVQGQKRYSMNNDRECRENATNAARCIVGPQHEFNTVLEVEYS
jgi:hypothetical protein